jgi:hypothetical protein
MKTKKSALPKELTTVTPLSKALALLLVVSFPFIGFAWGVRYADFVNFVEQSANTNVPSIKENKNGNKIAKFYSNGNLVVKLTVTGKIVDLETEGTDIPYKYKIVLNEAVTDKDAISDASGMDKPKTEYVLLTNDEKVLALLKASIGKKVQIIGTLDWGYAETRHLTVESLKLL